jgi:hypothetical protein
MYTQNHNQAHNQTCSLVITLAGAMAQIFSFFESLVENPGLLPELLGQAVPQQAFFFCFYIAQVSARLSNLITI